MNRNTFVRFILTHSSLLTHLSVCSTPPIVLYHVDSWQSQFIRNTLFCIVSIPFWFNRECLHWQWNICRLNFIVFKWIWSAHTHTNTHTYRTRAKIKNVKCLDRWIKCKRNICNTANNYALSVCFQFDVDSTCELRGFRRWVTIE